MPKAYSYIRMSTPEQMKGDSFRRQRTASEAYARENGLELTDIIRDDGVSAFKGKNAEFGALSYFLELAESGAVETGSYLIVESLDRLTRQNVLEAMTLLGKIIGLGINVVTLMDGRVYSEDVIGSDPYALMIASITMMRAHEESAVKSKRLSAAWRNKREVARNGGLNKQVLPQWLRISDDQKSMEVIADRAKIVQNIYELCCNGWGAYSIARHLNERNVATWGRASMWQESYVKKILNNKSVIGEYQPHVVTAIEGKKARVPDGEVIYNYYPKIISEDIFIEAQRSMRARLTSGSGRKGHKHSNIFSGLLKCGFCGSGIRYVDKGSLPKGGRYLRCSSAILTRKCGSRSIRYELIERKLLEVIRNVDFSSTLKGDEIKLELNNLKVMSNKIEYEIEKTKAKIDNIANAIAEIGHSQVLLSELSKFESQLSDLQSKKEDVFNEMSDIQIGYSEGREELLVKLSQDYDNHDEEISIRKSASSEIYRYIKKIEIKIYEHLLSEMDSVVIDERWGNNFADITIFYRNGAYQSIFGKDGTNLYFHASHKMNVLREKYNIESIE